MSPPSFDAWLMNLCITYEYILFLFAYLYVYFDRAEEKVNQEFHSCKTYFCDVSLFSSARLNFELAFGMCVYSIRAQFSR